jgi:hypothetical protein
MASAAPTSKPDPEGKGGGEHAIPQERVNAMVAKAKAEAEADAAAANERARVETARRVELEARIQANAAPDSTEPEKVPPTREQLRALVDEGRITQDQMDAELETQSEKRVEQRVASKRAVSDRAVQVNAEIDQYKERVPDLDDPTSDNHGRLQKAYTALRRLGYEHNAATELNALREVFGDLSKVKIPEEPPAVREVDQTTHSGGGGGGGDEEEPTGPGPLKGLEPHFVDYYTKGIEDGRYAGWDDPHLQKVMKREVERGK